MSDAILEEHGVLGEVNINELSLHFVPLEQDLLSLELEDSFTDLFLRKDPTPTFASAKALMLLQKQYGLFPRILGKGENAKRLSDLLQRMRNEDEVDAHSDPSNTHLPSFGRTPSSLIENLIIIDREVDFPTVLSTQLTYEGLIDETFGISNNQAELDSSISKIASAAQQQPGSTTTPTAPSKTKIQLDSTDKLFPALRDANFATVGSTLQRTARRLETEEQSMRKRDQTTSEMRSVVSALQTFKAEKTSLSIHTNIAAEIMNTTGSEIFMRMLEVQQSLLAGADAGGMHDSVEELIAREVSIRTVLRLLCLESCLTNGIRQRELDLFKRHVLHAYGFQHLITLSNLEKMGLLLPREGHRGYFAPIAGTAGQSATDWNAVRKTLRTWVDEVQEADPTDMAYVFSGYAPLSVRLVQSVLQKESLGSSRPGPNPTPHASTVGTSGWTSFTDIISRIRGPTVDVTQKGADAAASQARKNLRGAKDGPRTTIVFFLGGVTYAEVAALRLLSKQLEENSGGRKIVIATTSIINGNKCIETALEQRSLGE